MIMIDLFQHIYTYTYRYIRIKNAILQQNPN